VPPEETKVKLLPLFLFSFYFFELVDCAQSKMSLVSQAIALTKAHAEMMRAVEKLAAQLDLSMQLEPEPPKYLTKCLMCDEGYYPLERLPKDHPVKLGRYQAACGCWGHGSACIRPIHPQPWQIDHPPCRINPLTNMCNTCRDG
jgi:hypothetical protein